MKTYLLGLIPSIIIVAIAILIFNFARYPLTQEQIFQNELWVRNIPTNHGEAPGIHVFAWLLVGGGEAHIYTESMLLNRFRLYAHIVHDGSFTTAVPGKTAYFVVDVTGMDIYLHGPDISRLRAGNVLNPVFLVISINSIFYLYAKRRSKS